MVFDVCSTQHTPQCVTPAPEEASHAGRKFESLTHTCRCYALKPLSSCAAVETCGFRLACFKRLDHLLFCSFLCILAVTHFASAPDTFNIHCELDRIHSCLGA